MPSIDISQRHPSTRDAYKWLIPNPNLPEDIRKIPAAFHNLADYLLEEIEDCPQLVLALHSLTTAKDRAVRARMSNT